jgi:hypothetical protein
VLAVNEKHSGNIPGQFLLEQNYPNPFNPSTTDRISDFRRKLACIALGLSMHWGGSVATLVDEVKSAGAYTVSFNGSGLASGMYLYRLNAGEMSEMRRMMLVK